jgi:hypothetical protein
LANSLRKNEGRVNSKQRQKIDSRYDGIVQDIQGGYEYTAMETSKSFAGVTCTKWLQDYHKVAKVLHDMLFRLEGQISHDDRILSKLQVVGLVCAGVCYDPSHCSLLVMLRDFEYRVTLPGPTNESWGWPCMCSNYG